MGFILGMSGGRLARGHTIQLPLLETNGISATHPEPLAGCGRYSRINCKTMHIALVSEQYSMLMLRQGSTENAFQSR